MRPPPRWDTPCRRSYSSPRRLGKPEAQVIVCSSPLGASNSALAGSTSALLSAPAHSRRHLYSRFEICMSRKVDHPHWARFRERPTREATLLHHSTSKKENGPASRGRSASIRYQAKRCLAPHQPTGTSSGACELTRHRAPRLRRASSRLLPLPATFSAPYTSSAATIWSLPSAISVSITR